MKWTGLGSAWAVMLSVLTFPSFSQAQNCTPQTFDGAWNGEVTLCQNWDAKQQQEFWFLSQGSQIIPYDWFLSLEQVDSETLFRDGAHMDGFRYLPQTPTAMNPDGLPIGFTKDSARGNDDYKEISDQWLGLTCAACHTGQIEITKDDGTTHRMLIDGAPTMADLEGFMRVLVEAMQATMDDDAKRGRFVTRVLGRGNASASTADELEEQLAVMTEIRREWNDRNSGAPPGGDAERHRYGFARLDAIGAIFNEITATALGLPGNRMPANAPVSYPFIWDTPQHDRVQWNGSVPNAGAGALGRNVGEVLGVFGSIRLNTSRLRKDGHKTSVDISNLGVLEGLLWKLQSPLWPETILPEINRPQATQPKVREAFETFCLECHADIRRDDPNREIKAVLTPVDELGTDPAMAANFANRVYESGRLKRRFKTYFGVLGGFDRFEENGAGVEFLGYGVIGAITRPFLLDPLGTVKAIKAGRPSTRERVLKDVEEILEAGSTTAAKLKVLERIIETLRPAPAGLVYKGRPLNGIWATAPYLHNGSVRTMRQLLLPADMRQKTFRVGSREYDPDDMGFEDAGGYLFDTTVPGNSNAGHEGIRYGSETFKNDPNLLDALLEYLKTL